MTRIYAVGEGADKLVETYSWYAPQIDLQNTAWGISVVRIASVRRGQKPDENDLAIGFYLSGKTLKEYSTLDMSRIENDSGTVWSYFGIAKVIGYRWIRSNDYAFDVETGSGNTISFDVGTGALLARESKPAVPMLKDDGTKTPISSWSVFHVGQSPSGRGGHASAPSFPASRR